MPGVVGPRRCAGRRPSSHRYAPSHLSARLPGGRARRRGRFVARRARRHVRQVVAAQVAGRHGQAGRGHGHRVDFHAGRVLRRRGAGPAPGARVQRIRREDDRRSSRPVRHVRGRAAARRGGQPARDRPCAGRAQAQRRGPADQLRRPLGRRSGVLPGVRGIEPAQGHGLLPPHGRQLLRQPGARDQGVAGVPDRHDTLCRQPLHQRCAVALPGHPLHPVARRRVAAQLRQPHRRAVRGLAHRAALADPRHGRIPAPALRHGRHPESARDGGAAPAGAGHADPDGQRLPLPVGGTRGQGDPRPRRTCPTRAAVRR